MLCGFQTHFDSSTTVRGDDCLKVQFAAGAVFHVYAGCEGADTTSWHHYVGVVRETF